MESWKPIPGYEGRYEISSIGQVRSLYRILNNGRTCPARLLRPARRGGRYMYVMLGKDGERNYLAVHHLVLMAFVGPRPEECEGCHFDGNPINNSVQNLRWDTSKGNHQDRIRHGRTGTIRGEQCYQAKLTEQDVRVIRSLVSAGAIQRQVAVQFGIAPATVCNVIKGKRWSHVC